MKKENGNYKLIGGLVAGIVIGSTTIVCANQAIQAMQNTEIKVSLDGDIQEFKDETTGETQYPITYNNRTYLPLRNVAQLTGLNVDYDNNKNTALLETRTNQVKVKEISVVDAVNYIDGYYNLFKVRLPRIVGNSETVDELNEKILNESLRRTTGDPVCHALTEKDNPVAMDKGSIHDYKYIIKDNILIIYIYSSVPDGGTDIPATGGGLWYSSYCYDISNDKIISTGEAAKILNLSLDNVKAYNGTTITTYDELDNNDYNFVMKIDENEIILDSIL